MCVHECVDACMFTSGFVFLFLFFNMESLTSVSSQVSIQMYRNFLAKFVKMCKKKMRIYVLFYSLLFCD